MVTIETVEEADIAALAQLEACCFPKEEAADEAALRRRARAFPKSFLVMKKDGVIIGMINGCVSNQQVICDAMYEDESLHDPCGAYQTVFGLDVHPAHQHQGYARALMQAFIKTAQTEQRTGMVLTCKKHLVPFYEQFGFHNMGVSDSVHGGAVWYDMLLCFA